MAEPKPTPHEFLWLDFETTGLKPSECKILEWAVVLAADDRHGDMTPIQQYSSPVRYYSSEEEKRLVLELTDPFVVDMHTKNGLWAECDDTDHTIEEADEFLVSLCTELGAKPRQIVLAGASVHFDLAFAREHLPRFAEYLSHRVFDVSTLKRAHMSWGAGEEIKRDPAHRALPDVLESLAETKQWRERCAWVSGSKGAPVYHRWAP